MMGNKTRNADYDFLDQVLADSQQAQRAGSNGSVSYGEGADGTWITSKEQFDQLSKSVNDLEKRLRS